MKFKNNVVVVLIYLAVVASTVALAAYFRTASGAQPAVASPEASPQPSPSVKPRFSLSTNRTYGASEKPRIYISYQGLTSLDFRVYKVRDPFKFFKQLNDLHHLGEEERGEVAEVAAVADRKPSALEKLRTFKSSVYRAVKSYFRSQLRRESRTAFNDRFRAGEQLKLNESDYARVPLLNPDQLVKSWRQMLSPLEHEYDSRMINLGAQDPGVYLVEAVNGDQRAYTIAIVTDLTMINKTTPGGEMLVYAVDRKSGEPRSEVQVEIARGKKIVASGTTDRNGVFRVAIEKESPKEPATEQDRRAAQLDPAPPLEETDNSFLILARRRDEFAISDLQPYFFGFGGGDESGERLSSYIYTDRPVYRPEQKVYFKGILRRLGEGGYEIPASRTLNVSIADQEGTEIFNKDLPLSSRGTFKGDVELPPEAPLGYYEISASIGESRANGSFEVAEYKKPEFKVSVSTPRNFVPVGEKTKFTVEAKYFFGSPVANADVKYYIYRSRYYHWWWRGEDDDGLGDPDELEDDEGYYGYGDDMVKEGEGRLDAQGRMDVSFEVPRPDDKEPYDFTYRLEAQVTDSSRREMEGKAGFVGARGRTVVFARPERYVYVQNDTARINVKTTDYEGRPLASRVTLKFQEVKYEKVEEKEGEYRMFSYKPVKRELASAEVTTNAQGEGIYDYRLPVSGSIEIETFVNEGGRQIRSNAGYIYVADANNRWSDSAYRDYGSIKLVPDKKSYQPGDKARILAMLPTDKAHLLVTTEMSKIMDVRRIEASGRAVMIELPITENFSPNIHLSVAYVKNGEMYEHSKSISVPARNKFLQLEVIPDKKQYKPRDPASYTVVARNADGTPAQGVEVSLGVVDEAVYSIRPDTSGDIRRAFYGRRYSSVSTYFSTAYVFTGYSGGKKLELAAGKRSYQLADFKSESQYAEAKIRKDFKDTAFWQPDVVTGADGKASVKFTLPDNLTTWRATARAVTDDLRVGSNVGRVVSRKDLILRLETPRFMTEGDVVTVSGIVHNYQNAEKVTQIELKVTGANLLDTAQQTVTIPQQGEQRIDWRISAGQIGNVTLLATAKTNTESDGIELPLPVIPQGLKQTRANAAAMAEDLAEKNFVLDIPANSNTLTRSLRIEASPSIAGTMFGALDYLTSYPYGCTEQTMSSFLPNVVVAQALKDVKTASVRSASDLNRKVQSGMERLYKLQHEDGGWGWWLDDRSDPFMTAYVVDGLTLARRAGIGVNSYVLNRGRESVKQMIDSGKMEDGNPLDPESRAYLIYAYNLSGDADSRYVNDLFNKRVELQPYGRAMLALTLKHRGDNARAATVAAEIERNARLTEFDAHWQSHRRPLMDYVETNDMEATALSLRALAQINPQSQVLPMTARWLVANRRNGHYWDSTKHTAFALLALTDYLKTSRELSADYTIDVYLNGEPVLSKRVTAAEAAAGQPLIVERRGNAVSSTNNIRLVKRGAGVLYASASLEYFTREEITASQSSRELLLTREYLRLRVGDAGGKPAWKTEPLTGELRSGDLIVSRLHLNGARAQFLMIEDPIPAGCEQLERLSGINLDYSDGRWSDWYNNREFRDQRTVIFADYFDGDATFQYALRVQIPGEFKVPPARAELMYRPSVQANTENRKLSILDKK
jgi:hypothetical protein